MEKRRRGVKNALQRGRRGAGLRAYNTSTTHTTSTHHTQNIMGNLKKKRRLKMSKHKRRKRLKANRHKKRTWQK